MRDWEVKLAAEQEGLYLNDVIDHMHSELNLMTVQGTDSTLLNYIHGRCHLFAQALHEVLGYEMEFLWDVNCWIEGYEEPTSVLVHAYCVTKDGLMVDARGILTDRMLEREYEWNEVITEPTTMEQLRKDILEGTLFDFEENELEDLKQFIRENKNMYQ